MDWLVCVLFVNCVVQAEVVSLQMKSWLKTLNEADNSGMHPIASIHGCSIFFAERVEQRRENRPGRASPDSCTSLGRFA